MKTIDHIKLLTTMCWLAVPLALPAAVLINGGLEQAPGELNSTRSVAPSTSYAGWKSVGSGDVEFSTDFQPTAEGLGAVDLNGISYEGAIAQTLATHPGTLYKLRFAMSGNPGRPFENKFGAKSMSVYWGNKLTASFVFQHESTDTRNNMRWEYHEILVTGTGQDDLKLSSTTGAYSDAGPVIDDISLTPIITNAGLEQEPGEISQTRSVSPGSSYAGWKSVGNGDVEFTTVFVPPAEGMGAVDLNGISFEGAIAQTLCTQTNMVYKLRFAMSGNPGRLFKETLGAKTMSLYWGGRVVGAFTFTHQPSDTWTNMRWEYHEVFVTGSGQDELKFASTTSAYNASGPVIDDISLTPLSAPVVSIRVSQVEACWNSVSNMTYQVEYVSAMTTNTWVPLGSPVQGTGLTQCAYDDVPPGEPQRFYRVLQKLP